MSDPVSSALRIAADLRKAERRVDRNPSDAAKDAGTYRKGHLTIYGLPVTIENPKGSERSGVGRDGKRWSVRMPAAYGYVKGTEGHDGDHVDVYIGPDHASDKVFIVDQVDAETGKYDEHKCLLSFKSKSDAIDTYKKAFSDGKGEYRIGAVTEMSVADFKDWLKSGDTTKPVGELRKSYAAGGKVTRDIDMPLIKGFSRDAVSKNIKAERDAGKSQQQSIAIALDVARRAKKRAKGGAVVAMSSDIAPTYDYYMRGAGFDDKDGRPLIDSNSEDYKNQQRFLDQVLRGPNAQNGKAFRFQMEDGRYDSFGTPSFKPPQAPRSRYADGGAPRAPEVRDLSEDVLDGDALPPLTNRERRAIQRRAMSGLSPTDIELAKIEADRPRLEGNTDRLADFLTPFPAYGEFVSDPSIATATNAGVKTAMTAFRPMAALGALATGYGTAAAKDLGAFDMSADAQTARESNARARAAEAEGRAAAAKARAEADLAKAKTETEKQAAITRAQEADADLERQRRTAEKAEYERAVAEAEAAKVQALKRDRRFSDTETGKVYEKTGGVEGILAPIVAGAIHRAGTGKTGVLNSYVFPYLEGTMAAYGANTLPLYYDAYRTESYNPRKEAYDEYAVKLPPGHPRKAEMQAYAHDLPTANPVQAEARRELNDGFLKRLGMSGVEGIGAILGTKMANLPRRSAEVVGEAVEGVSALPGRAMAGWSRGMESADVARAASAEARARALSVADDVKRLSQSSRGEQQLLDEAGQLKAGANPRSAGPSSASGEVGPGTAVVPVTEPALLKDLPLKPGAPTNPTRTPPKIAAPKGMSAQRADDLHSNFRAAIKTKPLDEITLADLRSTGKTTKWTDAQVGDAEKYLENLKSGYQRASERIGVDPAELARAWEHIPRRADGGPIQDETKHHSHYQPRELGKFAGGPVYPSYDRGGTIQAAMDVARKYAGGGAVHVGPVVGETGGRSDKLPIDVPAGAFVVPADVVSALGEGNSLAGCKNLDRMMGDQRSNMASGGQAVPIKISDGEYVVSPEAVAKLGNGDMDVGHRALEKFVTTIRKQHIAQLQKLPPPAR